MRLPALLAPATALPLLAGCLGSPPFAPPVPAPSFSAQQFFSGHSEGQGTLHSVGHGAEQVSVHGLGHVEPDGTLVLDQLVERASQPRHRREWRLREVSPGHYAGTLSDAVGPVTGAVQGNQLQLAFDGKGGLKIRQWITLAPDGRSATNVLKARKMGVLVAVLDETIRQTGD